MVEIMVSIVIGSVLVLGIVNIFISSKQSYRLQENMIFMQENGRFSLQTLNYSLRLADHWGGVLPEDLSNSATATGIAATTCNSAWILDASKGIEGYEGGTTSPINCINNADYVPDSDVLVVRYASPNGMIPNTSLSAQPAAAVYVHTEVGTNGQIINANDATIIAQASAAGRYNYPYAVEAFFIRPCAKPSGVNCGASDDTIPTLNRLGLVNGTLTVQPLIEGVEQMQVEYGIDNNADYSADAYATASGVTDWDKVVSVRLGLLVRDQNPDPQYTDTTTYPLPGGYSYTPSGTAAHYHRRVFTQMAQLRNRSRR